MQHHACRRSSAGLGRPYICARVSNERQLRGPLLREPRPDPQASAEAPCPIPASTGISTCRNTQHSGMALWSATRVVGRVWNSIRDTETVPSQVSHCTRVISTSTSEGASTSLCALHMLTREMLPCELLAWCRQAAPRRPDLCAHPAHARLHAPITLLMLGRATNQARPCQ